MGAARFFIFTVALAWMHPEIPAGTVRYQPAMRTGTDDGYPGVTGHRLEARAITSSTSAAAAAACSSYPIPPRSSDLRILI